MTLSVTTVDTTKLRGKELAQYIVDMLERDPDLHEQDTWGRETPCGTTMCIAGHAAFLTGKAEFVHQEAPYSKIKTLMITDPDFEGDRLDGFDYLAADLLNLPESEANAIFYTMDNLAALHALKQVAEGVRYIDWIAIDEELGYND